MKSLKNIFRTASLVFSLIFILTGCNFSTSTTGDSTKIKDLVVHYIDVGQGDSILIQTSDKNLLIDAGPKSSENQLTAYLQKQGIKRLDYVIATHPHEDHIGGMPLVIKKFEIGEFYAPKKVSSTKIFENMLDALNTKKLKINTAKAGVSFKLNSDTLCEILAPVGGQYESINNYSAVLKLTYGRTKFLFMGDAEKLSEKEILDQNYDVSCDVLKVGHHGSVSSSSKEFLDKASPKTVVISCGKNNDYGHPHRETLDEFNKRNFTIYRTDKNGSVVLESNGKSISKK